MRRRLACPWMVACVTFACAAFSAGEAHARTCAVAADCPLGFDCLGASPDGSTPGNCQSVSCGGDADCGAGTRCSIDSGTTTCVTEPDGGQSCTSSMCVPQWDAPCSDDADCGPGFTCAPPSIGYYQIECSPDRVFSIPPYATKMSAPCPMPPFPPPNLCDGGTQYCFGISWKTCAAQQTAPCTVDSDCPSTWTCQCPATCAGGGGAEIGPSSGPEASADADQSASDAACTKACIPPNSDLILTGCNGSTAPGFGNAGGTTGLGTPGGKTGSGSASGAMATSSSPADGGGDSSTGGSNDSPGTARLQGGCVMGPGDRVTDWPLGAVTAFAWASLRRRGRRRVVR